MNLLSRKGLLIVHLKEPILIPFYDFLEKKMCKNIKVALTANRFITTGVIRVDPGHRNETCLLTCDILIHCTLVFVAIETTATFPADTVQAT